MDGVIFPEFLSGADSMRRQILLPLLLAWFVQVSDSPGRQPGETLPPPKQKNEALLKVLNVSIMDKFPGVVITDIIITDKEIDVFGRVPNGEGREELRKAIKAALVLQKAIADNSPHIVEVEGLIRLKELQDAHDKEVARFLNHRLIGPRGPVEGKLTDVTIGPEGVVVLRGSVCRGSHLTILERETLRILEEAVQAKNLTRRPNRIDVSQVRRHPNAVFALLDRSLRDLPELVGFKLIYADLSPGGLLELAGLAATEEQLGLVKLRARAVIDNAIANEALPMAKLERIDMTRVLVGSSTVDELLVIELLAPARPTRVVRAQVYRPEAGELILSGVVESVASRDQIVGFLECLPILRRVDATNVLVRQSVGFRPGEPMGTLPDAFDALGRMAPATIKIPGKNHCDPPQVFTLAVTGNQPQEILQAATATIRNAVPTSPQALNAWYLRAAAHLMLGQRQEAVGDLRVAVALAQNFVGVDSYYVTLERFQGPVRIALSNLLRAGPLVVVSGGGLIPSGPERLPEPPREDLRFFHLQMALYELREAKEDVRELGGVPQRERIEILGQIDTAIAKLKDIIIATGGKLEYIKPAQRLEFPNFQHIRHAIAAMKTAREQLRIQEGVPEEARRTALREIDRVIRQLDDALDRVK
jgi:hypothetical protein